MIFEIDLDEELKQAEILEKNFNDSSSSESLNVENFSSPKLCSIIVANRYLNTNRQLAILAMQELAKRRDNGDLFDFEKEINDQLKDLPQINFNLNDLLKNFKMF